MSKPAQRGKLATLHAKLAETLAEALDTVGGTTTRENEDGDMVTVSNEYTTEDLGILRLTAAFLKDNDITCDDDAGDDKNEQLERLNALRKARTVASTPMDELH